MYATSRWTKYTAWCEGCGCTFRISRQALSDAMDPEIYPNEPYTSEEEAANSGFQVCLGCATGEPQEGEIVRKPNPNAPRVGPNHCPQ